MGSEPGAHQRDAPLSRGDDLRSLITLVSRPSGWRRLRLFGASARSLRVRRRVDAISLVVVLALLLVIVPAARTIGSVEQALYEAIIDLPTIIDPFAALGYDLLAGWALVTLLLVLVRGQWRLLGSTVVAIGAAAGFTALANEVIDTSSGDGLLALGAPLATVPVQLVMGVAVVSLTARELSRPFRMLGHRLLVAGIVGALLLPVANPSLLFTAVLVASAAISVARLVLGSPVVTVSPGDVRDDLADVGVIAEPDERWTQGVPEAVTADGRRLEVEVLGRDEWDAHLMVSLWRFVWYRNSGANVRLSPRQRIEHQAFLLLMAASRGAAVTPVVAVGPSRTGDLVLATERSGRLLADLETSEVDDALVARLWEALFALHSAGISHGRVDDQAVLVEDDGEVRLRDFRDAQAFTHVGQVHADRAQLLVTTALLVGPERAVRSALDALGETDAEGAGPLVANLQVAVLDDRLRAAVDRDEAISLEALRTSVAAGAGIEEPELQKVWRVTWGSVLRLGFLAFVAYVLISQLADIGWDTIVDAVSEANPLILAFALVFGQVPRVATAASLQTASPAPVPLGRVTRLEFAITFVNLAVPSTAARVAMNIRFFQRSGANSGAAISAGALDSIFGFIAQITLLGGFLLLGLGTLSLPPLPSSSGDRSDLVPLLLGLVAVVVVVGAIVWFVGPIRARVVTLLGELHESLTVLRSPARVARLFLFNVLDQLLFSATIWIVLQAFGQDVAFTDAVVINVAVALFAGLMPVPGGVGVTEAALTAGFVAVGVPQSIALAAALCYRLCTFYLPPLWGYVALRSLRNDGYL